MKQYEQVLLEAVALNKRKNEIADQLIRQIGTPKNRNSPNHGITAVAKTFLLSGYKLSGQILDSVRLGHLLIAVLGVRPLFELTINSIYTFNHPKHTRNYKHMRRVCKDIIRITNRKRNVNHAFIDGKHLKERVQQIGLSSFYRNNYRGLSDWSHIMMRTPYISRQVEGEKFGVGVVIQALCLSHDIIDSISEGFGCEIHKQWEADLRTFRDKY